MSCILQLTHENQMFFFKWGTQMVQLKSTHKGGLSVSGIISAFVHLHLLSLSFTHRHTLCLYPLDESQILNSALGVRTGESLLSSTAPIIHPVFVASYCRCSWLSCCHSYGHRSAAPATIIQPPTRFWHPISVTRQTSCHMHSSRQAPLIIFLCLFCLLIPYSATVRQ